MVGESKLAVDDFFTIVYDDVIDAPIYGFVSSHNNRLCLLPTQSLYESFKFGTLQTSITVCVEGILAR